VPTRPSRTTARTGVYALRLFEYAPSGVIAGQAAVTEKRNTAAKPCLELTGFNI
jgi:hypothetical protein